MLFDLLSLIFSAFLGGLISLGLYKLSERKEKDMKRLQEFHELIIKTKEIAFESTDLLSEFKKIDKESIKKCRNFTGTKVPNYTLLVLSHIVYIDKEVYNKTIDFIDLLRAKSKELGDNTMKSHEFIDKVNSFLEFVSREGFDLLNFLEIKYQKYLGDFGYKHMDK